MKAEKKVIILDNIKSEIIAQAIFILNDGAADEFSAVSEAERIVWEYLGGVPLSRLARHTPAKRAVFLSVLAVLLISAILFCVIKIF